MPENAQCSEYIFRWDDAADSAAVAALKSALGATVVETSQTWGFELWQTKVTLDDAALTALCEDGFYGDIALQLEYAQSNLTVTAAEFSSDPRGDRLWGMHNTGQTGGTEDADIDLPEAWEISRGAGVVVAVLDTGVDYTHEDLAANMWVNDGEIAGNGIDDDGNGFVDDIYGYDFAYNDGDPMDGNGHGTHVAGTIAAVADNGIGVAGVAPEAQIMALKFLDDNGSGSFFDAIQALDYAVAMGADVSNNSWGSSRYSTALSNAISLAGAEGHTFVAAAGNNSVSNETSPHYPASYTATNVISVAATDDEDQLAYFSNYGFTSVDVAAPGRAIYSTLPGDGYGSKNGTSMAAPHVTGIVALLLAENPDLTPEEIKSVLIATSDPVSALASRTASGGRVNAAAALAEVQTTDIVGRVVDDADAGLSGWRVFLDLDGDGRLDAEETSTITGADGTYRFGDLEAASYRVVAQIAPGFDLSSAVAKTDAVSSLTSSLSAASGAETTYRTVAATPWTDISANGTALNFGDEGRLLVGLPFDFNFFGQSYDRFTVTANGLLCFEEAPYGTYANGIQTAPAASIAPFWTDLTSVFGGTVRVMADAQSGTFTVQYDGVRAYDGTGTYSFQTVLHSDGDISFRYLDMTAAPEDLGMGLVGPDRTYVVAELAEAMADGGVRFTTKPQTQAATDVDADGETALPDFVVHALEDPATGGFGGRVWLDADEDGLHDWGEAGLSGRTVYLDTNGNGTWDTGEAQATTDSDGSYSFTGLTAGRYTVRQLDPTGWHATTTGTDSYQLTGTTVGGLTIADYGWRTAPGPETALTGLGDDGALSIDLPFLFPFFGQGYDAITVSANGYLTFRGDGGVHTNESLEGQTLPGPMIAAFWTDLNADDATITYWHDAAADLVVVSFEDMRAYDGSGAYTFQVALGSAGGITLAYKSLSGNTESATVGIADGTGTGALEVLDNGAGLSDEIAFEFTPVAAADSGRDVVVGADGTVYGVDMGSRPDAGFVPLPDLDEPMSSAHMDTLYDAALLL